MIDFFNVVTVDEARGTIMEKFKDYSFELEEVNIIDSLDRILGEDIFSDIDVPEFDRSTVDGYAIVAGDSYGASDSIPSVLDILGEVHMGERAKGKVASGNAIYVPTGGMVPEGSNGIIMIEHIEKLDENTLLLNRAISNGENITYRGDDIKKGSLILKKGKKINPQIMGVFGALGKEKIKVYRKPKFYIISTGDEIIDIDEELKLGKVRDINSFALLGEIKALGGEVTGKTIVKDSFELLKDEVEKAVKISDIVLISGGSSVGVRDFTKAVIDSFKGEGVFTHGLSIKPGKPTIIGEGGGKLIFGLPGHPVSSIIVFKALVEDYIKEKMNIEEILSQVKATMDFNFPSASGRLTYQMVNLREEDGNYFAIPNFGKSSMISLLKDSDGFIVLERHEEGIYKGEERTVFLL